MQPPRAPREPQSRIVHGHAVLDDYAWMADRDDPRLRAYLEAENAYAAERTGHLDPLVERIVGELKSRTVETDLSVAVRHGGWWYYGRTIEGAEYPVHARVAISDSPDRPVLDGQTPPAHEQVLLDENVEAGDADFFAVGASEMSPDGRLLAWSADREGDERYDLVVREVDSGAILDATVRGIGDPLAWSLDNRHIFYTRLDDSWRSHEIWRHEVGTAVEADELVLAESDERFFLSVGATADDRWIVLSATSKTAAQVWLIDAADPRQAPRSVLPRRDEVIYDVDPLADGLLVLHNAGRANFQVDWLPCAGAPVEDLVDLGWTTPDEFVTGMDAFATFVVLSLRVDGLTALRFVPVTGEGPGGFGMPHDLTFPGETGTLTLGSTPDPTSPTVQVAHTSMATPPAIYDYDVRARTLLLLKAHPVPGVDLSALRETRIWAIAPDGVAVPVTGEGPGGFGMPHDLTFPGETGTLTLGSTPDPASPTVQVAHTSMATPPAIYDYDVRARTLLLLKAHPVPGVDLSALRETRIWATAPDGVAVPVSLVHHADVRPDGTAAVLLYGYGAYGIPSDPWFSVARLSLLHRGVVFAIAHVRGGTELGWDWYVQGRLEHKPHSFTDFLACADALVDQGWAAADRVAAEGGSAGGLLVAAAATQAPARFRAVLAQVPFVDVLTTMLDPSLPLTVTEQQEWGDPIADPAAYDLIAGYSPYETVPVGDFPALLITTSANDTRVFVTEPAKWMARLRDRVTDDPVCRPLLMRTQLTSGHGGRSGRYQAWREIAWEWAVLLDLLGAADQG